MTKHMLNLKNFQNKVNNEQWILHCDTCIRFCINIKIVGLVRNNYFCLIFLIISSSFWPHPLFIVMKTLGPRILFDNQTKKIGQGVLEICMAYILKFLSTMHSVHHKKWTLSISSLSLQLRRANKYSLYINHRKCSFCSTNLLEGT